MQQKILDNVNIVPEGKELILASGLIELQIEKSYSIFQTVDLYDFIEWVKYLEKNSVADDDFKKLVIEYDDTSVELYNTHRPQDPFTDNPLAILVLTEHPRLKLLREINGKKFGIDEFSDMLSVFKDNMASTDFMDLIGNLKDFRINKVTNIQRTRDKKGNFAFICTRQRASNGSDLGQSDFEPPETLKFRIPIFEGAKDTADFVMDFKFDYNADDGNPRLYFTLGNISLGEQIRNARKAILQERVKDIQIPAFWGSRKNAWHTDEWRYIQNRPDGLSVPRKSPE